MAYASKNGEELEGCEMMADCAIIDSLSVCFSNIKALDEVTIKMPSACVTVLLGRSGSGKTTLLRSLNRLNETFEGCSSSGRVSLLIGGSMTDIYGPGSPSLTELRRCVGMVFQTPNPLPMSVRKNMILPMNLVLRRSGDEAEELMEKSLKDVGLWDEVKDRLNSHALELSGGQQQRLCLARTLALKPDILLLDEPTASLDKKSSELIEEYILSQKDKFPVIMVSHSLVQARKLGDRFIVLSEGRIKKVVTQEDIPDGEDADAVLEALL